MPSNNPFDQRLRDVFSLRSAIPVLNEYLSTIQVDWQVDNVTAFVAAANSLDPAQAPQWLRTRPPLMTCSSFTDDVIAVLEPLAKGRCGHVMLAPNTTGQFGGICAMMGSLQSSVFLQDAAQLALPVANDVEKHLVETHYLVESKAQRHQPNHLPPALRDGQHPLRRVFI
ncbi:hypothetical protein PHYSODRAFT_313479 [Phytophthora sojae]|uniref:Uncharacterized protein n=1 Tax=Phytophthora sojae (strain P6497) TaxID=1094619 RepID=G4Z970_PHYSP|nr:hypothetical protein PHYSODRAFT_313479 [Phytophthora sojae]EGZ21124.1 hypothetical protein PHYSODRAFT_313479 [Phytophthora sojae]|eukprot:XP_009523841.1 hypothetical protein PHYSODRAFT_313479 [Phytophthora sojae]